MFATDSLMMCDYCLNPPTDHLAGCPVLVQVSQADALIAMVERAGAATDRRVAYINGALDASDTSQVLADTAQRMTERNESLLDAIENALDFGA